MQPSHGLHDVPDVPRPYMAHLSEQPSVISVGEEGGFLRARMISQGKGADSITVTRTSER